MEFNKKMFSERLLGKINSLQLSMRQASKIIGISAPTISRITSGESLPDIYTYFYCCRWLGDSMEVYFQDPQIGRIVDFVYADNGEVTIKDNPNGRWRIIDVTKES